MENLNKLETAAALAAVSAVIGGGPPLSNGHPLKRAKAKLEHNLTLFNLDIQNEGVANAQG